MFFTDKQGRWWSTFFGHNTLAPITECPAIPKIEFDEKGHARPMQ